MIVDIEAAVIEARDLADRLINEVGDEGDAQRLGELFKAIDGWMTIGGFLPESWRWGRG